MQREQLSGKVVFLQEAQDRVQAQVLHSGEAVHDVPLDLQQRFQEYEFLQVPLLQRKLDPDDLQVLACRKLVPGARHFPINGYLFFGCLDEGKRPVSYCVLEGDVVHSGSALHDL